MLCGYLIDYKDSCSPSSHILFKVLCCSGAWWNDSTDAVTLEDKGKTYTKLYQN